MSRTARLWAFVLTVVAVAGGCSRSEPTQAPGSGQPRPAAVGTGGAGADVKSDGEFVRDVAEKIIAEIELSRMALDKSSSPAVKALAQMVIRDHEAAERKLKGLISGQAIEWPGRRDDKQKEMADDLAKKQGLDFNRDYAKAMIKGHEDLAAKLEARLDVQSLTDWKTAAAGRTQSKALPDPKTELRDVEVRPAKSGNELTAKINQWAAETYPAAQKRLDTARTLENAIEKGSTH